MPTFCQRGSSCSWGFGRCRSGELAVKFSFMGLSVPIPRPLLLFLCWRSLSSARSSGRSSHKPRYRLVSQKKYINPAAVTHRPTAIVASWKLSFISATITKESTLWYTELEKNLKRLSRGKWRNQRGNEVYMWLVPLTARGCADYPIVTQPHWFVVVTITPSPLEYFPSRSEIFCLDLISPLWLLELNFNPHARKDACYIWQLLFDNLYLIHYDCLN